MKRQYFNSTQLAACCIFSFFMGRLLQFGGEMPDGVGRGPVIRTQRQALETVTTEATNTVKTDAKPFGSQKFQSFEEMLEASGMLSHKPPVPGGETGSGQYMVQPFQILSWFPRAYLYPDFLPRDKCQHVIDLATKRLVPSGLAFKQGDTMDSTRNIRTSQGTFMTRHDDPDGVLTWIEEKISALTFLPVGNGEAFNILRYENGQHYDSHYDAFDETQYGKQYSQRVATVLIYLTDVEEGGETSFLFEGKGGTKRIETVDYKACDTGIKYKPRAGDALLFWSMHPNITLDKHALHGGCPVVTGTKWSMTKWLREQCSWGPEYCDG